ncbi:hypothetical protein BU17DRAFT_90564 [Hysterangium stoloniferum]|nr:hypothetical protein BU17DRAFT_90564 [Hysterangium stoloniferum]
MSSSNPDQVTSRLHTLRGEAYRHQRNLQNIRVSSSSASTHRGPSLPPTLYTYTSETDDPEVSLPYNANANLASIPSPRKAAGPPPPRSWVPSTTGGEQGNGSRSSSEWRGKALELIFRHSPTTASLSTSPLCLPTSPPRIPSLLHLTLHVLLFHHDGIPPSLLRLLPRHILREYVRFSAVHFPLPKEAMEVLWGMGCDGEVMVIGPGSPSAALEATKARSAGSSIADTDTDTATTTTTKATAEAVPPDWDAASLDDIDTDADDVSLDTTPTLPHTFIALSTTFTPTHLSQLPTTLSHLALINVPRVPVHLLPAQVPFIEVLDLSFNAWLGEDIKGSTGPLTASGIVALPPLLHRIEWRKWGGLRVLGLRGCGLGIDYGVDAGQDEDEYLRELRRRVNKGRLGDVAIVFGE